MWCSEEETTLYYLQSRYYDPELGRFVNADAYASTGQGLLGNNMFAYCGNNPVNRADETGCFFQELWELVQTTVNEIGSAIRQMSYAYAACGSGILVDGPFPYGDVLGLIGAALVTVGAVGLGICLTAEIFSSRQQSSSELSIARDYARDISRFTDRYVVHHIVAQYDPRAYVARDVLKSVGIDPRTSGINLAVIPERKHLSIHTQNYYTYINLRLAGLKGNESAVIWTLYELQLEIQFYCQTGWKMW